MKDTLRSYFLDADGQGRKENLWLETFFKFIFIHVHDACVGVHGGYCIP